MANCEQILTSKKATLKVRDERIDSVKYWLIVLVIIGHVLTDSSFINKPECIVAWKWIYIFHMPLFVFISGFFSRKKKKEDFKASMWKLLEPLIIYHILGLITTIVINKQISITQIFTPWWVLWYLSSLIIWRIILQLIPDKLLSNTKLILIVTFIIGIISGFLPFNMLLSLQRTLSFMPFFFFGYCMRGNILFLSNKYKPFCYLFLFISFTIPLYFQQYLGSVFHAHPYDSYFDAFSRILVFCISIPMSIAFINICHANSWIAKQGRLSMQYFIYHPFILILLMKVVRVLDLPITLTAAFVYSTIITVILCIASYFPYFDKYTNPSSFIKKK